MKYLKGVVIKVIVLKHYIEKGYLFVAILKVAGEMKATHRKE